MQAQRISEEEIVRRGLEIYEQKLKPILEPAQNGRQVAICVEDGDYEVADTAVEADRKLRPRHPDAVFMLAEVGNPILEWPWARIEPDAVAWKP